MTSFALQPKPEVTHQPVVPFTSLDKQYFLSPLKWSTMKVKTQLNLLARL